MSIRALVSIDGFDFPEPAPEGYSVNFADIVDSGRNLQGFVTGAVVRDDVIKISLSWNYLTASQLSGILKCFNRAYGGSFFRNVTFYNPIPNAWETRRMYVGDRNPNMWLRSALNGECRGYTGFKLSLIEV